MTTPPGVYGFGTPAYPSRPRPLPAVPPKAIPRVERLREEALAIITVAGGRTDDPVRAWYLRGLEAEEPEMVRWAWDAAAADYAGAHPPRTLTLLDALREGHEIDVDSEGARIAQPDTSEDDS